MHRPGINGTVCLCTKERVRQCKESTWKCEIIIWFISIGGVCLAFRIYNVGFLSPTWYAKVNLFIGSSFVCLSCIYEAFLWQLACLVLKTILNVFIFVLTWSDSLVWKNKILDDIICCEGNLEHIKKSVFSAIEHWGRVRNLKKMDISWPTFF